MGCLGPRSSLIYLRSAKRDYDALSRMFDVSNVETYKLWPTKSPDVSYKAKATALRSGTSDLGKGSSCDFDRVGFLRSNQTRFIQSCPLAAARSEAHPRRI